MASTVHELRIKKCHPEVLGDLVKKRKEEKKAEIFDQKSFRYQRPEGIKGSQCHFMLRTPTTNKQRTARQWSKLKQRWPDSFLKSGMTRHTYWISLDASPSQDQAWSLG